MELADFITQIRVLIDLNRYDEAITRYPEQARLVLLKAHCLEQTGQRRAAEKVYLHVL